MKWIAILVVVVGLMAGAKAATAVTRTIRTSQGDVILEDALAGSSGGGGLLTLPEGTEFEPNVVGGALVKKINKFPQVVAIVAEDKRGRVEPHCSGVIIDNKVVLSAAHCFEHLNKQLTYSACSGTLDIKKDTKNSKCARIENAWKPKAFDPSKSVKFDIALLSLSKSITSSFAKRVKVSFAKPKNGLAGFSVGFGRNKSGTQADGKMRSAAAKVVLNEKGQCKFLNKIRLNNKSNLICGKSSNAATCKGDSGSPLLVKKGNELICVGSLSLSGCKKGNESAYSSLYNKDHAKVFKAAVKKAKGKFLTGTLPKK